METLPRNKTAEELGLREGDKFEVVDVNGARDISGGDIVTLIFDDGSTYPLFRKDKGESVGIYLYRLRPLCPYKVGDVLEHPRKNYKMKIIGVIGDVIVTEDSDDATLMAWRISELQDSNWELPTKAEIKEVTLEEIAEKFGVPVDQLHIKKESE